MREIKFRAWDKVIKSIVKIISLDYECDVAKITKGKDIVEAKLKELELMQYTGLKDKNRTEIYEGDILKRHWFNVNEELINPIYFECKFGAYNADLDEYSFSGFGLHFTPTKMTEYGDDFSLLSHPIEVIGNIYEATPEQKREWGLE